MYKMNWKHHDAPAQFSSIASLSNPYNGLTCYSCINRLVDLNLTVFSVATRLRWPCRSPTSPLQGRLPSFSLLPSQKPCTITTPVWNWTLSQVTWPAVSINPTSVSKLCNYIPCFVFLCSDFSGYFGRGGHREYDNGGSHRGAGTGRRTLHGDRRPSRVTGKGISHCPDTQAFAAILQRPRRAEEEEERSQQPEQTIAQ